jgi:hypothetical protein
MVAQADSHFLRLPGGKPEDSFMVPDMIAYLL